MTCAKCSNDLICRTKEYGGNYPPTLQWQNYDGTAHYKTTDGKSYECNLPDEEEVSQSRIPSHTPTTPGDSTPQLLLITRLDENIKLCNEKLDRIEEVLEALFRYTVQEQLKKK